MATNNESQEALLNSHAVDITSGTSATMSSKSTSKKPNTKGFSNNQKNISHTAATASFTNDREVMSQTFKNSRKRKLYKSVDTTIKDKDDGEDFSISPQLSLSLGEPSTINTSINFSELENYSDDDSTNVSDSPYEVKPPRSSFFLNAAYVNEIHSSFKNYDFAEKTIIRSPTELNVAKLTFQKYASTKKATFSQFK